MVARAWWYRGGDIGTTTAKRCYQDGGIRFFDFLTCLFLSLTRYVFLFVAYLKKSKFFLHLFLNILYETMNLWWQWWRHRDCGMLMVASERWHEEGNIRFFDFLTCLFCLLPCMSFFFPAYLKKRKFWYIFVAHHFICNNEVLVAVWGRQHEEGRLRTAALGWLY